MLRINNKKSPIADSATGRLRFSGRSLSRFTLSVFASGLIAACASSPVEPDTDSRAANNGKVPASAAKSDAYSAAVPERFDDVWDRVRAGYGMEPLDSPLVARHERWFSQNTAYMDRMVERARLYLYYIVDEVEKRNMPTEIALLPAIESAFKPHAYSRARAAGLWQFIPSTGRHYGLDRNWWYDQRRDVVEATQAALDYLEKLHTLFEGDWHLALAAYTAGETRVMNAIKYNRRRGLPTGYQHLRTLKPETLNYVPKLLAVANIVAHPEKHGVTLASITNEPYFARVEVGSQIDLGVVAKMANISLGDLYDINPALKRRATAPDGPHHLLVPHERREILMQALENLPEENRVRWKRHRVRHGDALSTIARRYRVSVSSIKRANGLRSSRIRAGSNLLIPISAQRLTARDGNVTKPVKRKPRRVAPPPNTIKLVHQVRPGDTLWGIAVRYDVYIYQLAGWNNLHRRSLLRPGQKIKVWVKPELAPTAQNETIPSRT
jgi:membrane-bound lytic murein transglycosylase D